MTTNPVGTAPAPRIVAGVDGSDSSQAALRWAVRQAKLAGGRVEAVTAWHYPAVYGWETAGIDADFEGDARRILAEALTAITGPEPDIPVLSLVTEGYPADVLLHTAKDADLLVLGRRGHGGVTSALLGSVSTLHGFFNLSTWLTAIAGAAVLLLAYHLSTSRRNTGRSHTRRAGWAHR